MIAEIFDQLTLEEVFISFQMLGTRSIENYSPELIKILFDKFSSEAQIQTIYSRSNREFLDLAKYWP